MIPKYPLTLRFPYVFDSKKDASALSYLFYISQLGGWIPINGMPFRLSIKSMKQPDKTQTLIRMINELQGSYLKPYTSEEDQDGARHYTIELVARLSSRTGLDVSLEMENYDSMIKRTMPVLQPISSTSRDWAYNSAIKDLLFLAVCSADSEHLQTLLKDPQTLSVAKENRGVWLLNRVIGSHYSIAPFAIKTPDVSGTLAVLFNHGVITKYQENAEIIKQYEEFFNKGLPNVLENYAASVESQSTSSPVSFRGSTQQGPYGVEQRIAPKL